MCLKILNYEWSIRVFNHTNITLVPKIPNLSYIIDFRPIRLYYVIYKIITKALTNRFTQIILIYENHYVSIPNWNIHNNALTTLECIHLLNILNHEGSIYVFNHTNIAFGPEIPNLSHIIDSRPISLCFDYLQNSHKRSHKQF